MRAKLDVPVRFVPLVPRRPDDALLRAFRFGIVRPLLVQSLREAAPLIMVSQEQGGLVPSQTIGQ
jgi:hypothetical protein